jgi:hypothetical protein
MEDVLEVYTRPYDPLHPQVCMDETSKQLLRDARPALSMGPGRTRVDGNYGNPAEGLPPFRTTGNRTDARSNGHPGSGVDNEDCDAYTAK